MQYPKLLKLCLLAYIGFMACKVKKEVQRNRSLTDSLHSARQIVQLQRRQAGKALLSAAATTTDTRQQGWLHIDSITQIIETAPDNSSKVSYRISGLQTGSGSHTMQRQQQQKQTHHQQEATTLQAAHRDSAAIHKEAASLQKSIKRPTALWLFWGIIAAALLISYLVYKARKRLPI